MATKTKKNGKTRSAKPAKKPAKRSKPQRSEEQMSVLDAAAKVLAEAGQPLRCGEMVEAMLAKGYWATQGKTPASTIYSAILREIGTKGSASRFVKSERGKFALASQA